MRIASMPTKCIDHIPIPNVAPPQNRQNSAPRTEEEKILLALSSATNEAMNATTKEIPIRIGSHDT